MIGARCFKAVSYLWSSWFTQAPQSGGGGHTFLLMLVDCRGGQLFRVEKANTLTFRTTDGILGKAGDCGRGYLSF